MKLLAVDPGNIDSAYVLVDTESFKVLDFGKVPNQDLRSLMATVKYDCFAIEMIASYGMAVGKEVFETCVFIGRLIERSLCYSIAADYVYRKDVKLNLCQSPRAKDGNIIQALKDRFGDKGVKKAPGFFFGFKADCWQAYAVAVTWIDSRNEGHEDAV